MAKLKAKNHVIYGDQEFLRRMKEEAEYLGRQCELREDRLVIFALPQKKVVQKVQRGQRRGR